MSVNGAPKESGRAKPNEAFAIDVGSGGKLLRSSWNIMGGADDDAGAPNGACAASAGSRGVASDAPRAGALISPRLSDEM